MLDFDYVVIHSTVGKEMNIEASFIGICIQQSKVYVNLLGLGI